MIYGYTAIWFSTASKYSLNLGNRFEHCLRRYHIAAATQITRVLTRLQTIKLRLKRDSRLCGNEKLRFHFKLRILTLAVNLMLNCRTGHNLSAVLKFKLHLF